MTHTCNLSTWAAKARELLQIWGRLGLHRECPTTLDYAWSKALPLWCGIVNKEDSWLRCATPFCITAFRRRGTPTREEPLLVCSTAGGPVSLEFTLLITPLFWQSLCENTIDSNILNKAFFPECWLCCSAWLSALAQEVFSAPRCHSPPLGLVPWDLSTLYYLIILLWKLCAVFPFFYCHRHRCNEHHWHAHVILWKCFQRPGILSWRLCVNVWVEEITLNFYPRTVSIQTADTTSF